MTNRKILISKIDNYLKHKISKEKFYKAISDLDNKIVMDDKSLIQVENAFLNNFIYPLKSDILDKEWNNDGELKNILKILAGKKFYHTIIAVKIPLGIKRIPIGDIKSIVSYYKKHNSFDEEIFYKVRNSKLVKHTTFAINITFLDILYSNIVNLISILPYNINNEALCNFLFLDIKKSEHNNFIKSILHNIDRLIRCYESANPFTVTLICNKGKLAANILPI